MDILGAVTCQHRVIVPPKLIGKALAMLALALLGLSPQLSRAGGGPLGIDH